MEKQKELRENWIHRFENLYIMTWQMLYYHARLLLNQEDQVKELLILTYMEAYQRSKQISKEKDPSAWLLKRLDFLAESKMGVTKEMLEASYAEERMQSKEAKKENWLKFDETTLLLEIEERLGIEEEQEPAESSAAHTGLKGVFSLILLVAAVLALVVGMGKVRNKVDELNKSVIQPLQETSLDIQKPDFVGGLEINLLDGTRFFHLLIKFGNDVEAAVIFTDIFNNSLS